MKLYLVSNAHYSDGGTLAIFSTEEKAKAFVDIYNKQPNLYTEAYIETYELDHSAADNIGSNYIAASISLATFEITIIQIVKITEQNFTDYQSYDWMHPLKEELTVGRILKLSENETALEKIAHICTDAARQYKATGIIGI